MEKKYVKKTKNMNSICSSIFSTGILVIKRLGLSAHITT